MYEVIVKKVETVTRAKPREWVVLTREEELRERRFTSDANEPKTHMVDRLGYAPQIDEQRLETVEIYNQKVPELDLPALVAVVNGLATQAEMVKATR